MRFPPPGRLDSVDDFIARVRELDLDLPCDAELRGAAGPLGTPIEVCGRTLSNRFAIHPMEGWDGTTRGLPSEDTLRRWRRFGASGAALIWGGEAYAVHADGRANPNQLYLDDDEDAVSALRALRAQVASGRAAAGVGAEPFVLGLQLTHSGRFARPTADGPAPLIAHAHPILARKYGLAPDHPLLTDAELESIADRFVVAAASADAAGFDFVDVKCCHGYLLHELLGAHTRPGPYGGSFENRTRLFRRIVGAIRTTCPDLHIGVRVSIADLAPFGADAQSGVGTPLHGPGDLPYRSGFGVDRDDPLQADFEEPARFLALLRELGIRLVNVTIGSPYYCPHRQRPAAYPPSDGYEPPHDPLVDVAAHVDAVRRCRRAEPDLAYVLSGLTYLQEWLPHVGQALVAAGDADFLGLGRMVLSYPDLPLDALRPRELDRKRICRTFSDCTTAPRHGLPSGCYPLDAHYKSREAAVQLRVIKRERRVQRPAPSHGDES